MRNLILTELKLRSTDWANVSGRYRNADGVSISRGKTSPTGQAGPSQANITLDNTGGTFAPRNPNSEIAGQFGRNTPLRVSVVRDEASFGLVLRRAGNGCAQVLDNAAISLTGDLDVRIDLELLGPEWVGADPVSASRWKWTTAGFDLASKSAFFIGTVGWGWLLLNGVPTFKWSANGTNVLTAAASAALSGADTGRRVLRVTIDVDNGASGRTITFYEGTSMAGPWTMIGTPNVQAGVTAIFDNDRALRVGAFTENSTFGWGGSGPSVVYEFELRNGIDGPVVASSDYTVQELDPNPFASGGWDDAQGNHWLPQGSADAARIWYGKVATRFVGEVAEWPPRWDPSHRDKYVPITANGILRRLGQGKSPEATSLRDYILQPTLTDALTAYYPLTGEEGTTYSLNLAPNSNYLKTRFYPWSYTGVRQPVYTYGQDMGASWIGTGVQINATGDFFTGDPSSLVADAASGDPNVALDMMFQSLSLGVFTIQLRDYDDNRWVLALDTPTNDGTLQVSFTDPDVGPIGFTTRGPFIELSDVNLHHLRFQLTKNGSDTDFAVYIDGTLRSSGTMPGYVLNGWSLTEFFYSRYVNQTYVNIAHVACWANANPAQIPDLAETVAASFGYQGERAADRITRVAGKANIPNLIVGDPATSTKMGPQFAEQRLSQIRDAETTDFGILTEQRDDNGLLYRTRTSMYAQVPRATVDYSARVVAPPFEPIDDDALIRNDVTASRRDGGSYELRLTTGAMSTLEPPFGIGQYEDEVTVNVETDDQLPAAAAWWLNLGTLDAARFDSVTFNLAAREIQDDPDLLAAILALDVGDRMVIQNVDAADIPDDVDLIIQGYTEVFDNVSWLITFTCAPGQPYQVAKYGTSRYDHPGSTLNAAITTTATSASLISDPAEMLWTVDPVAFPFDLNIGGERVTCTAITSATSPQTATLVRSINGVVAAHSAGTTVRLWDTPRYAY